MCHASVAMCMYVCMHVPCMLAFHCTHACKRCHVHVCMYVCMHVRLYAFMCVCMCACMIFECMCACMHVRLYAFHVHVCMYVCVYAFVLSTDINNPTFLIATAARYNAL